MPNISTWNLADKRRQQFAHVRIHGAQLPSNQLPRVSPCQTKLHVRPKRGPSQRFPGRSCILFFDAKLAERIFYESSPLAGFAGKRHVDMGRNRHISLGPVSGAWHVLLAIEWTDMRCERRPAMRSCCMAPANGRQTSLSINNAWAPRPCHSALQAARARLSFVTFTIMKPSRGSLPRYGGRRCANYQMRRNQGSVSSRTSTSMML